MTLPIWMLLAFALWTVAILFFTIGIYRWSRILTRKVEIKNFRVDNAGEGSGWYQRAMRAHANCVENLPVFGAVVFALYASGLSSPVTDGLAVCVVLARIIQSVVHVGFTQTNTIALLRFVFFLAQIICMVAISVFVIMYAL